MSAQPKERGHSCPPATEPGLSSPLHDGLENPSSVLPTVRGLPSSLRHRLENPCYVSEAPTARQHASPGQRPGLDRPHDSEALKGRDIGGVA